MLIGSRMAIASPGLPCCSATRASPHLASDVGGVALEDLLEPAAGLVVAAREVVEQRAVRQQRKREGIQLHGPAELRDGLVEPPA